MFAHESICEKRPSMTEDYAMVESTLGIMTFFEWHFALTSLSKGAGLATFLRHGTEARSRSKDLQAKQSEFLWSLGLLCLQNKSGRLRTQGRLHLSFGSGPRDGPLGCRISRLLLRYLFTL